MSRVIPRHEAGNDWRLITAVSCHERRRVREGEVSGQAGRTRARGQAEPDQDQLQHIPNLSSPIAASEWNDKS